MSEDDLIRKLQRMVPLQKGRLVLGIGDDCAIYRPDDSRDDLLFTTDQTIEGRHFLRGEPMGRTGYKALARGLSDIAAMGGVPEFFMISLALRDSHAASAFFQGALRLAKTAHVVLAGGDLARSTLVSADVMVCGRVRRGKALLRSGVRNGDTLFVTGALGRAASKQWRDLPNPRIKLGRKLVGHATACMDLSDGLSTDLRRMALASGVAAMIENVPAFPGATLDQALHGGEDYELLFASREAASPYGIPIGRAVDGPAGFVSYQGKALPPLGHDHFA